MTLSHRTNNEPHTVCFVECSNEKIDFLISFCILHLDCIRSSFNQDRNIESFKTNQNRTKWSGNGMFNTKMKMKIRTDTLRNQCDIWVSSVLQTRSVPLIEISICSDAVNVCKYWNAVLIFETICNIATQNNTTKKILRSFISSSLVSFRSFLFK